jgi:steroid delta-isomerase-like uncharacterized protein
MSATPTDTATALARRFLFEHNQEGYLASFDDLLASDVVVHEYLPGLPEAMDRAGYEGFIGMFRASLPDIGNTLEDLFVAGDRVAIRWTGSGTHTGAPLLGIPASGKRVKAHGIYILRLEGDRIAEVWNSWDGVNLLAQLGALPGGE